MDSGIYVLDDKLEDITWFDNKQVTSFKDLKLNLAGISKTVGYRVLCDIDEGEFVVLDTEETFARALKCSTGQFLYVKLDKTDTNELEEWECYDCGRTNKKSTRNCETQLCGIANRFVSDC